MKKRVGFTLIEIAIFLAITGLLFIGVAVGTSNSVSQQRFTDAVQSFAEFLRSVYSQVANPQSYGDGRSNKAIYGKLIVFGEKWGLDGEQNTDNRIFVYDVIGNATGDFDTSGSYSQALYNLGATVIMKNEETGLYEPAGIAESYLPKWASKIESVDSTDPIATAVLIVRHPRSGTINTLVKKSGNKVINSLIIRANKGNTDAIDQINKLPNMFKSDGFETRDVDFCVDPNDDIKRRQDVRIIANAHNAAGVEILPMDSNKNLCRQK